MRQRKYYDNDGGANQGPIWPQTYVHTPKKPLPHGEDVVQAKDKEQRHKYVGPESERGGEEQQKGVPQALLAQIHQQDRPAHRGRTRQVLRLGLTRAPHVRADLGPRPDTRRHGAPQSR